MHRIIWWKRWTWSSLCRIIWNIRKWRYSPLTRSMGTNQKTNCPTDIRFIIPSSEMHGNYMTVVPTWLAKQLEIVQESMAKYHNKRWPSIGMFRKRDLGMLNEKNIRLKGRCRKWNNEMFGLFTILLTEHNDGYSKLESPQSRKIHPTCNNSVL
jgi:hypothetical protein